MVVVADGGSTDGTAEAARVVAASASVDSDVQVVVVESRLSGRANCLNVAACVAAERLSEAHGRTCDPPADAAESSDAYYVFLHADTVLPNGFGAAVTEALRDRSVAFGSFKVFTRGVRDHPSVLVRLFARFANGLNNLRSVWMETPYGDQGLFCRRSTFERLGGFPSVPLMEDSAFCREARRHGRCRILETCVQSFASPQWSALGVLYVMRNYLFLSLWAVGAASPEWIHGLYYAGRPLPPPRPYEHMARDLRERPQELLRDAWASLRAQRMACPAVGA